jgi:hypothetical protein
MFPNIDLMDKDPFDEGGIVRHMKNNAEMDRVVAVESSTCRSGMGPQ